MKKLFKPIGVTLLITLGLNIIYYLIYLKDCGEPLLLHNQIMSIIAEITIVIVVVLFALLILLAVFTS